VSLLFFLIDARDCIGRAGRGLSFYFYVNFSAAALCFSSRVNVFPTFLVDFIRPPVSLQTPGKGAVASISFSFFRGVFHSFAPVRRVSLSPFFRFSSTRLQWSPPSIDEGAEDHLVLVFFGRSLLFLLARLTCFFPLTLSFDGVRSWLFFFEEVSAGPIAFIVLVRESREHLCADVFRLLLSQLRSLV